MSDLNLRQEQFCKLYATDKEFFGNGASSYIEAYEPDTSKPNWYKTACTRASQLLSTVKVCERVNSLLEQNGLNDQFIDKQLLFLVTQHSDFGNKMAAIKEYNKLKTRVTGKLDITTNGETINPYNNLTTEELRKLADK